MRSKFQKHSMQLCRISYLYIWNCVVFGEPVIRWDFFLIRRGITHHSSILSQITLHTILFYSVLSADHQKYCKKVTDYASFSYFEHLVLHASFKRQLFFYRKPSSIWRQRTTRSLFRSSPRCRPASALIQREKRSPSLYSDSDWTWERKRESSVEFIINAKLAMDNFSPTINLAFPCC